MFFALSDQTLQIVNLLAVAVIPTLVAMITRSTASSGVKSIVMMILNAIAAITTSVLDQGGYTLFGIVFLFVQNVVFSAALYYGVAKPVGLAGPESSPAKAVPGFVG